MEESGRWLLSGAPSVNIEIRDLLGGSHKAAKGPPFIADGCWQAKAVPTEVPAVK